MPWHNEAGIFTHPRRCKIAKLMSRLVRVDDPDITWTRPDRSITPEAESKVIGWKPKNALEQGNMIRIDNIVDQAEGIYVSHNHSDHLNAKALHG